MNTLDQNIEVTVYYIQDCNGFKETGAQSGSGRTYSEAVDNAVYYIRTRTKNSFFISHVNIEKVK